MAALLALLGSSAARAADWEGTPSVRIGAEYADNPLLVPKNASTYTSSTGDGTADLSADVAKHGDGYDLSVDPRALFARYLNRSLFDHDDQYLNLAGDVKSERTTWQGSVNGTRDTALTSEVGLTGITDTNRRHESLTVSGGPNYQLTERMTLTGQGSWLANHYVDAAGTGLVDYRYLNGDVSDNYALTERSQLGVDVSAGQLSASLGQSRSTNYALQAVLTSRLTELWTATLSGGPSRVDFGSGQKADGAVYAVGLQHQGELYKLNAKVSQTVTPTGRGVLTKYDQLLLSASGSITERLSTVLTLQYSRNRDYLNSSATATGAYALRYYNVQEDLQWKLTPSWSLSLTAQAQRQYTTVPPNPGANAYGYRVNLGLVWIGRPRRL